MTRNPDDRPLSAEEVALTRWLLEHGTPEASRHLADLPRARVVGRCGCGCASVDFAIADHEAPLGAGLEVLADYEWRDPAGRPAGVFVFARAGMLAGLKVWTMDPDADTSRLPSPDALWPLGSAPAT